MMKISNEFYQRELTMIKFQQNPQNCEMNKVMAIRHDFYFVSSETKRYCFQCRGELVTYCVSNSQSE